MNKEKKKNISNTDPLEEQAFATHFGHLKENLIACELYYFPTTITNF